MLGFAAGEWAAVGASIGVVAAFLTALLSAWKLVDRMREAVRGVVREEQAPTNDRLDTMQVAVTEIRDDQREHNGFAGEREKRLDDHAEKIGDLGARVTRLEDTVGVDTTSD